MDIATSIDAEIQRIEEDCRQRVQRLEECKRVVADPLTLELLRKVLGVSGGAIAAAGQPPASAGTATAAETAQAVNEPEEESTAIKIAAIHDALAIEEKSEQRALAASAA